MANQPSAARRRVGGYHGPREDQQRADRQRPPDASRLVQAGQRRRVGRRRAAARRSAARSRLIRSRIGGWVDHQARRARLELLDRVGEVHVLGRRGWRPRGPPGRRRSWPAPARGRTGCGSARRADASARYSRWRLTASWMNRLMIGARIARTIATIDDDRLRRRCRRCRGSTAGRRQPAPEREAQEEVGQDRDRPDHARRRSSENRMSRLRTCDSSWPMTPWSSSRSSFSSRPRRDRDRRVLRGRGRWRRRSAPCRR